MDFATNEGAWFDYVPGKPEQGRVKLRVLDIEQFNAIKKATEKKQTEYKPIRKNGPLQRFEFVEVDEDLATEMRIDKSILEWEKTSLGGKDLKCTTKNKIMMFNKSSSFRDMYVDNLRKLSEDNLAEYGAEDEMGN